MLLSLNVTATVIHYGKKYAIFGGEMSVKYGMSEVSFFSAKTIIIICSCRLPRSRSGNQIEFRLLPLRIST